MTFARSRSPLGNSKWVKRGKKKYLQTSDVRREELIKVGVVDAVGNCVGDAQVGLEEGGPGRGATGPDTENVAGEEAGRDLADTAEDNRAETDSRHDVRNRSTSNRARLRRRGCKVGAGKVIRNCTKERWVVDSDDVDRSSTAGGGQKHMAEASCKERALELSNSLTTENPLWKVSKQCPGHYDIPNNDHRLYFAVSDQCN
jgi:hypothetical protein